MGSQIGDLGGMLSHSRSSPAESLTRDSIDCAEGTRSRGGTPSSRRGEGDFGLCSWRAVSGVVSGHVGDGTGVRIRTLDPECKARQRLEPVCALVILDKLEDISRRGYREGMVYTHCSLCASPHHATLGCGAASISTTTGTEPTNGRRWSSRRPARPEGSCGGWGWRGTRA